MLGSPCFGKLPYGESEEVVGDSIFRNTAGK